MALTPADLQHKRERKAAKRRTRRKGRLRRNASVATENWSHAVKHQSDWSPASFLALAPFLKKLIGPGKAPQAAKQQNRRGV